MSYVFRDYRAAYIYHCGWKDPFLFAQCVRATLDIQLLLPEYPAQYGTGPPRKFPQLGWLQASRVGLYATVSQHLSLFLKSIKL